MLQRTVSWQPVTKKIDLKIWFVNKIFKLKNVSFKANLNILNSWKVTQKLAITCSVNNN